ncbi:MAG: hypothetical protein FWC79_00075 [Oscillospiraceae bacterium]|nr:hypothetical protein [Oscillospiraceae bacterium]
MRLKRILLLLMIIAVAFIIGNLNEVMATNSTNFGIRVITVDSQTNARTTNSRFTVTTPNEGFSQNFNMGSIGTDFHSWFTNQGVYTFRQTQVSTGGYASVPEIRLDVRRDAQGRITSATTNRPVSEVRTTIDNNGTVPIVTVEIRETRTGQQTQQNFTIGLRTSDRNHGNMTSGAEFRILDVHASPQATRTYNMPSSGFASHTFRAPTTARTVTYTITQHRNSSSPVQYNSFGNIVLNVTFNAQGQITNVTTTTPNVNIHFTTGNITLEIREARPATEPHQQNFTIGLRTSDRNHGNITSGAEFRILDVHASPQATRTYNIPANGFASHTFRAPTTARTVTYTITQHRNSSSPVQYNAFGTITLNVTFNAQGHITNATSTTPNVGIHFTAGNITLEVREARPTQNNRQNEIAIGLRTLDRNNNQIVSGAQFRIVDTIASPQVTRTFNIPTSGVYSHLFQTPANARTVTYTITQHRNSSSPVQFNSFGTITLNVTYNAQGHVTNATSTTPNVVVHFNSGSVLLDIREARPQQQHQQNFNIGIRTSDRGTAETTSGAEFRIIDLHASPQATRVYNIPAGGFATNTFRAPTTARTVTYVISQHRNSSSPVQYNAFGTITLNVTFNAQGQITNVTTPTANVEAHWNTGTITLNIREARPTQNNRQNEIAIGLRTFDRNNNQIVSGAQFRIVDTVPSPQVTRTFNIPTSGAYAHLFQTPATARTVTYTITQHRNSSSPVQFNSFGTITLNVTYNAQGHVTNATSTTPNVVVTFNSGSVLVDIREARPGDNGNIIPPARHINIALSPVNRANNNMVTGGTYVVRPAQGNSMTYTIGTSGTASHTFPSLAANTAHRYVITRTNTLANYYNLPEMAIYVTYDANGNITRVTTTSPYIAGSFTSTSINLRVLETRRSSSNQIIPEPPPATNFTMSISTPGNPSGTLRLDRVSSNESRNFVMTGGTASHSNLVAPGVGRFEYRISNVSHITGNNTPISVFITFDASGRITTVSTNSRHLTGGFSHNNVSITLR